MQQDSADGIVGNGPSGQMQLISLGLGLLATIGATWYVGKLAKVSFWFSLMCIPWVDTFYDPSARWIVKHGIRFSSYVNILDVLYCWGNIAFCLKVCEGSQA